MGGPIKDNKKSQQWQEKSNIKESIDGFYGPVSHEPIEEA
jgi:hypothetical protein